MTNSHDVREQQFIRDKLQADVDAYLARGGKIETLAGVGMRRLTDDEDDAPLTAAPFGRNYPDR